MTNVLELRGATKRYPDFTLRDVSFSVPPGVIMGLVGPNGAGKSTIVKLILNLVSRDSGDVLVCGADAARDEVAAKSRIGFVHEVPTFYAHKSVAGLAAMVAPFYPTWDREAFARLIDAFELPSRKLFGNLSRGMRTKVALALAMSHHADLLLLDEPTSGLDPVFRRDVLDRLMAYVADEGASVLFSTHITADLERVADYITFVNHGSVVFSSTRDDVMDRWALVKGPNSLLDENLRAWLRGVESGPLGFVGVSDDIDAARARLAGLDVVIERPSLEDIVCYTRRSC
jgi:ABC-2 type transport system ATP-binding protein